MTNSPLLLNVRNKRLINLYFNNTFEMLNKKAYYFSYNAKKQKKEHIFQ